MTNARAITVFDPDTGAVKNCVVVERGEEEGKIPPGMSWCEGEHYGRICMETGTARALLDFSDVIVIEPNRISGIPEGTKVIAGDEKCAPFDGTVEFVVEHEETVQVRLAHPLYEGEGGRFEIPCSPAGNPKREGFVVDQPFNRMRVGAYAKVGTQTDQLDEIWKVLRGIAAILTAEQIAQIDAGALATMEAIADVKVSIPKKGPSK